MNDLLPIGYVILLSGGLAFLLYVLCKWLGSCRSNNDAHLSKEDLAELTDYPEYGHDTHQKNLSYEELCEKPNHYSNQLLHQSIDLATKAIEADRKVSYQHAIELYDESVAIFTQLAAGKLINEKEEGAIREKCLSYADRAKCLREYLKKNQTLQQAIDLVTKATEEDKNRNYREALKLYDEGVATFSNLVNNNLISEAAKNSVLAKSIEYRVRAEKIRKYLDELETNENVSLQLAVTLMKKATEEDENENYSEALRLYEEGMSVLSNLMEADDVGEASKDKIRKKCEEFVARMNKIKKYFENEALRNMESGNEYVVEATEADQNNEYLQARHLYGHASDFFSNAMNMKDLSIETLNSARTKYDECNEKVVNITKHLLEHPTLTSQRRLNDVMQKAIEEDKKQNYEEARRLYRDGFDIWSYLMRDDATKLTCHSKYDQYHEAVAELICKRFGKQFLDKAHCDTFKLFHIKNVYIEASKKDKNGNDEEALKLCKEGHEYYTKLDEDGTLPEKTAKWMREACEHFKERAEYLEDFLKE